MDSGRDIVVKWTTSAMHVNEEVPVEHFSERQTCKGKVELARWVCEDGSPITMFWDMLLIRHVVSGLLSVCRHTPPYLYPHPYRVPHRNPHPHPHPHSYLCPAFALFSSRKCRCRSRRMSGKCRQQLRSVGDNNWNSSPGFPGPFPRTLRSTDTPTGYCKGAGRGQRTDTSSICLAQSAPVAAGLLVGLSRLKGPSIGFQFLRPFWVLY